MVTLCLAQTAATPRLESVAAARALAVDLAAKARVVVIIAVSGNRAFQIRSWLRIAWAGTECPCQARITFQKAGERANILFDGKRRSFVDPLCLAQRKNYTISAAFFFTKKSERISCPRLPTGRAFSSRLFITAIVLLLSRERLLRFCGLQTYVWNGLGSMVVWGLGRDGDSPCI